MYCTSCGKQNDSTSSFCIYCGNKLNKTNSSKKTQKGDPKKIVVISMLSIIIIMLGIVSILLFKNSNTKRTIMLYIDGSDLESRSGIITADLAAIDSSKINLDKVNILVYTGGTKDWQNDYISNEENAIFILTNNGFKKIKTYDKKNMGDPNTLTEFLKFGYENYKASRYNLVLYDHGGAIDGAIYDDFSSDNLSLSDFKVALENSPFNKNNKFDSVIFRTCLNGTLEVASLFVDYSDYIVFSEEVSYGGPFSNVLSFINNIESNDNGYVVGKKFVDQYKIQMSELDRFGTVGVTYSVVDLSKVNDIIAELDNFVSGIDLSKNYNNISKVRNNIYQYAKEDNKNYDTVDLKTLVQELNNYSSKDGSVLLKKIDDALLYNYTNMESSNGISIYFPYNGHTKYKRKYLDVYKQLDFSNNYRSFITSFANAQLSSKRQSFSLSSSESKTEDSGREVSLQLTKEELDTYTGARYIVFERNQEHPNYYKPIYSSNDVDLSDSGVLKTKIGKNIVSLEDKDDGQTYIIPFKYRDIDGVKTWTSSTITKIYDNSKDILDKGFSYDVDLFFKFKKGKPYIANAKIALDNDERIVGSLVDIDKFDTIELYTPIYKILDENGNYTEDWESAPELTGISQKTKDLEFKTSTLKNGEYYVVFYITDINNNSYASNLIKVGN